ncbi:hypothetical protein ACHAXA_006189 [Cyclostephanos tholiformis]|uniref:Uncharacterized protein n=1 Tax=Cyclostephanos tholiformis TaxID=382380 RepID=A0ABD3RRB9_9STRA
MAQPNHGPPETYASAFVNQSGNEKLNRQIHVIISSALALFLISAFVLVAMLPSPNERPFPHVVIRSPETNLVVVWGDGGNGDKSSLVRQRFRHSKGKYVGTEVAKTEVPKETLKLKEKPTQDIGDVGDESNSGDDVIGQDDIINYDDGEISSDESDAVAETNTEADPADDVGNSQNETGDEDGIISDEENDPNDMVYDDDETSIDESMTPGDDSRLIHVLETRFMQNQPNLVELAKARLHLFKTICLPTIIHQSAWGDFLWIIRTDPELHIEIKEELVHILNEAGALTKKDENGKEETLTYVIGSNDNYVVSNVTAINVQPFDIRAMLSDALSNPETIFAGKAASMKDLFDDISQPRFENDVVIWTRLDADDGLNRGFLAYIQDEAIRYFIPQRYRKKILTEIYYETQQRLMALSAGIPKEMLDKRDRKLEKEERKKAMAAGLPTKPPVSDAKVIIKNVYKPPKWTYWCAGRNLDWFVTDPLHDPQHKNGTVFPVVHVNVCVTPGVTIALRGSFDPLEIPRLDHDQIISYLRPKGGPLCGRTGRSVFDIDEGGARSYQVDDGSCFHLVTVGIAAVRSRTPTSAGMLGVNPDFTQREYIRKNSNLTSTMWKSMKNEFRISDRQLVETNLYFADHIYDIAMENARGQCTAGHSCKSSAKDSLQRFVDLKDEKGVGFDVVNGRIVVSENNMTPK